MEISEKRLIELERASAKLNALEAGGVDNWEWYDESLKGYRAENEHAEKIDSLIIELSDTFGECAYEPSERGAGIAFSDELSRAVSKVLNDHGVIFKEE